MTPPIPTIRPEEERIAALKAYLTQRHAIESDDIRIIRAPLRICPLGAHIDHQHGIVTGMTIDQSVLLAYAPTSDGTIHLESTSFDNSVSFNINTIPAYQDGDWGNYARGAVTALQQKETLTNGIVGAVDSGMPVGGLSSSAAVTVAYLLALQNVNNITISPHDNIALVSHAEQKYIGLNNGILDQTSILFSQPNSLTRIDCQDRDISLIASTTKTPYDIMIVYSGLTKNSLVATGYNNRVAECREAASNLLTYAGQNPADARLRDVDPQIFADHQHQLPQSLRKRATHYFGEMDRVQRGLRAWQVGDIVEFGKLMTLSGDSSVNQYECGSPQLITLYEALREADGVYGTRFSGAGFRGNCIALIDPAARESIADAVHARYPQAHPAEAPRYSIHYCQPAGPAQVLG